MTPVEFKPPAVALPAESDNPVGKIEVDEVVTLVILVVAFVAVALLFHVNGGWDEVVGNVELRAAVVTATAEVLVGYAVSPSTLVGMGKVVMLVKYFLVADVFGVEVIGDVDVSCLGSTAALTETTAKAIELRRRNCMFVKGLLCVWDVNLRVDEPWQRKPLSCCIYRHSSWRRLRIETVRAGMRASERGGCKNRETETSGRGLGKYNSNTWDDSARR
jgi:hypothetical protein